MAANASARQMSQLAVETTYGTVPGSPAWKRFTSFGLNAAPNMGTASATPRGQTAPTSGWISREDSSFTIEGGVLSYDEVNYILESAIKKAGAPTTVGTTGKQRVYGIGQFQSDPCASFVLETGSFNTPQRVYRAPGAMFNEFGFEISSTDDQIGITGGGTAWKLAPQGSPGSGTPQVYQVAIPTHFTLGYAATYAGLSAATPITSAFTCGFSISDRRSLVRYLGNATGNPSDTVETIPGLSFSLTLADETTFVDPFLTSARAGDPIFFRLKGEGKQIGAGPAKFTFMLDICARLTDNPSLSDQDGVQVVTFPFSAGYDSVADKIFEITTISDLTSALS